MATTTTTNRSKTMARTYNPPHEDLESERLAAMITTLHNGGTLPAILVSGENALTGSHRLAAWLECGVDPETVELPDADYEAALIALGLDPMYDSIDDFNEFCAALYLITESDAVKDAIEDQRG